jgi:hypothetical protein
MVSQANRFQAKGTPKVIWKFMLKKSKEGDYSPGCCGISGVKHADKMFCRMNLMHDE